MKMNTNEDGMGEGGWNAKGEASLSSQEISAAAAAAAAVEEEEEEADAKLASDEEDDVPGAEIESDALLCGTCCTV